MIKPDREKHKSGKLLQCLRRHRSREWECGERRKDSGQAPERQAKLKNMTDLSDMAVDRAG